LHSEIYEIDYRGPETHSSIIPPPHHFHVGKPHSTTPHKGSHRGTKALRDYGYPQNKASFMSIFIFYRVLCILIFYNIFKIYGSTMILIF